MADGVVDSLSVFMKRQDGVSTSMHESRKCAFTLRIDTTVESGAFEAPGFRFRFLDGSRKQTSAIGSSPGWTAVHDTGSTEGSHASLMPFRFEQTFPDVVITEAFAAALDDDPILSFFLFDHPGLAGTGTTPRSQTKEAKPSTAKTGAMTVTAVPQAVAEFVPKAFSGLYEMDVSRLLAGNLQVKQTWTLVQDEQTSRALRDTTSTSDEQPTTLNLCQLSTASGLKYLSITLSVDQAILAGDLLKRLNPLTITIGTARRMPGAISQGMGTASAHTPLHHHCKPAFALIHFFPDKLRPSTTAPNTTPSHSLARLLVTPGQHQVILESIWPIAPYFFNQFSTFMSISRTIRYAGIPA